MGRSRHRSECRPGHRPVLSRVDLPARFECVIRALRSEQKVLRALKDHTKITLGDIRATIGDAFPPPADRAGAGRVVQDSDEAQVVLIAGPAGSGKSAIAKDALAACLADHFALVSGSRSSRSRTSMRRSTQPDAGQCRHASRDPRCAGRRKWCSLKAWSDCLNAQRVKRSAISCPSRVAIGATRVILTCRDYSVELVRASFLQPARIEYTVVRCRRSTMQNLR